MSVELHLVDAARVCAARAVALAARVPLATRRRIPDDHQAWRGFLALQLAIAQLGLGARRLATAFSLSCAAIACADVTHLGIGLDLRPAAEDRAEDRGRFRPAEQAWIARVADRTGATLRVSCRKAALAQALAAEAAPCPTPLVLAPRVAVGGVTLALHDLPVLDPIFAALAAPLGERPLPVRYWSIDDQGTLTPSAPGRVTVREPPAGPDGG